MHSPKQVNGRIRCYLRNRYILLHWNRLNRRVLLDSHSRSRRHFSELANWKAAHSHYIRSSRLICRRSRCYCQLHLCQRQMLNITVSKPERFRCKTKAQRGVDPRPCGASEVDGIIFSDLRSGRSRSDLLGDSWRSAPLHLKSAGDQSAEAFLDCGMPIKVFRPSTSCSVFAAFECATENGDTSLNQFITRHGPDASLGARQRSQGAR
jgi:hypothetical protein